MPRRLLDYLPTATIGIPSHIPLPVDNHNDIFHDHDSIEHEPSAREGTQPSARRPAYYQTSPNEFGVFRCYPTRPVAEPQEASNLLELSDTPTLRPPTQTPDGTQVAQGFGPRVVATLREGLATAKDWFYPFLSPTVFRLMAWANTGSNLKSNDEVQRLVDEVILAPDFNCEELRRFRVTRELERLDSMDKPGDVFTSSDGWHEQSVKIAVPKEHTRFSSEAAAPMFEVQDVFVRKLTAVIQSAAEATDAFRFNWLPFRSYWRRRKQPPLFAPGSSDSATDSEVDNVLYENIRMFSDVPDTDAMLEEDARLRTQARNPEDSPDVEYAIAPILVWSDSTHLANFGGAHLWPI
ncbi:hypothetical protein DAEQUDRAFT_673282, partial [Daedalea quercina L-15889]